MVSKQSIKKVALLLPKRPKDANKGTFGKVLAVAGSENYPGAAYLACAACYRVGAGLVTLVTSPSVKTIVSKRLPEVTFLSPTEVSKKLLEYNAILIGPGLGQKEKAKELVRKILEKRLPKLILDADALNILSKMGEWWSKLRTDAILTPHPGEMARLSGLSVTEIQQKRENIAKKFAKIWGKVVVLKGANTTTASPDGEIFVSPFANAALATAGTGDVLAGIITGLIAQGLNNFDAACCGVYVHGVAGEMLREKIGNAGAIASDLLPLIPKALLNISKHRVS